MSPRLRSYLIERRRALITELRSIEAMLSAPESAPQRGTVPSASPR